MLHNYFISAGASTRPNISDTLNDLLVYASGVNIIIADTSRVLDVILRESGAEITYLYTTSNEIICCDVLGNIESYDVNYKNKELFKSDEPVFFAKKYKNFLLFATLSNLYFYNYKNKLYTNEYNEIISQIEIFEIENSIYFLIAFHNGFLELFDYTKKEFFKIQAHKDLITSIKLKNINNELFLATASSDFTAKIWKIEKNKIENVSTLFSHKDIIYSINWSIKNDLITSSADNTVIIWKNETYELIQRVGGLRDKNQMFYNAFFIDDLLIAQSSSGGFYKYKDYKLKKYISGHTDEINSIDCKDDFVITSSLDKTSRIFSIMLREEIARPQIHGYPLTSIKFIKNEEFTFISGAQETILRVYKPTLLFLKNYLNEITKLHKEIINYIENKKISLPKTKINYQNIIKFISELTKNKNLGEKEIINNYFDSKLNLINTLINDQNAFIAKLSELSLSNEISLENNEELLKEGNNERNLSMHFLFQEVKKVYGHYFDTSDVAVSEKFIISCNKSSSKKYSKIFIYDLNYTEIMSLNEHDLGIQKLKFSNDGQFIIACSRDKKLSFYKFKESTFKCMKIFNDHKRIVWDCAFSFDNKFIASVSKDKNLFIYNTESYNLIQRIKFDYEPTCVCFANKCNLLFVGFENGIVFIYKLENDFELFYQKKIHAGRIKSILVHESDLFLFSGGEDRILRMFNIEH
ncbi:Elongator subunit elp2 [Gurleya vavrai]